jgi:outer membrane protein assembly factor BamA
VFFGEIIVVGNEHIKTDTILRLLKFQTGSAFNDQAIVDSRLALNSSLGLPQRPDYGRRTVAG